MASREDIIAMVRARMDELTPFDAASVVSDGNSLLKPIDAYIDELLEDAINDLLRVVPLKYCVLFSVDGPNDEDGGAETISLPNDYLRFASARGISWERDVTELTPEGSPRHIQQLHEPTRAGVIKPVVVLTKFLGEAVLRCYPHAATVKCTYVPMVKKGWTKSSDFCVDGLLASIGWMGAAKVFTAISKEKEAKQCMEQLQATMMAN